MRAAVVLFIFLATTTSHAQRPVNENKMAMKEFIRSSTYGVLAGTLVGAATLAFTDQPGENLNKVARGASLGLYAGIALGLYVVYVVPGQIEKKIDQLEPAIPAEDDPYMYEDDYSFNWQVYPLISQSKGLEGAGAGFQITAF